MSTHFFTNRHGNTLSKKLEGVLSHMQAIHYFEAVIGYFRASGYFRLRPFLDNIPVIRILVGINVDTLIHKANTKGLEYLGKADDIRDLFLEEVKEDIQKADYRKEIEEGIIQLIKDIASKKVQIRAFKEDTNADNKRNLHCKIYIFTQEHEHEHAGWGTVITGSSNLSITGLEKNVEFNVELRNHNDVKFAKDFFKELWEKESVEILPVDIHKLKKHTHLNEETTPFDLYVKLLIEYFGKNIDIDHSIYSLLPSNYDNLAYQAEAVDAGMKMLQKHNGFILADVVGLGKTVVAAMVIKKYIQWNGHNTKVLVIYPPALATNWKDTIKDFRISNYVDFITNGSLHKIIDYDNKDYSNAEDYDFIIVDESHKFRNDTSQMYAFLQMVCKTPRKYLAGDRNRKKKVVLLSATPLNNRPEDIANQIYLFQDARNTTIEGIPHGNLQSFFAPRAKAFKELKKDDDDFIQKVRSIYAPVKEKVLTQIVIRRTRADIQANERWWSDMKNQNISFPSIDGPNKFHYQFDDALNNLFYETVQLLMEVDSGFQYFRYRAIEYLKEEYQDLYENAKLISRQLAYIMRTLLVKRLESSFMAFKSTLNHFRTSNQNMIDMFANNKVYIAPDLDVNKYINEGKEDELEEKIAELAKEHPNHNIFKAKDFEDGFLAGLEKDQELLEALYKKWSKINNDPKLNRFVETLQEELFDNRNIEKKLVVFTESTQTAEYLKKEIAKHGFDKALAISSKNQKGLFATIRKNFDPKHKAPENKFNIIITTDVLAEGINLHRSNIIVNYDVPWNSTRLMQRIGRVNRLGTKAETIYVYNFYPTAESDDQINLNKTAISKLQGFHTAFSEDSQIYSNLEQMEDNILGDIKNEEMEERDRRQDYLEFIRKFREEQPKEFRRIQKLPLKTRVCRDEKQVPQEVISSKLEGIPLYNGTLAYIRNKARDAFFFTNDKDIQELTFLEAIQIFETKLKNIKKDKPLPMIANHHNHVLKLVEIFNRNQLLEKDEILSDENLAVQEKNALNLLKNFEKAFSSKKWSNPNKLADVKTAQQIIKRGIFKKFRNELARLRREMKKRSKKMSHEEAIKALESIFNKYPIRQIRRMDELRLEDEEREAIKARTDKPQIILSESFTNNKKT